MQYRPCRRDDEVRIQLQRAVWQAGDAFSRGEELARPFEQVAEGERQPHRGGLHFKLVVDVGWVSVAKL